MEPDPTPEPAARARGCSPVRGGDAAKHAEPEGADDGAAQVDGEHADVSWEPVPNLPWITATEGSRLMEEQAPMARRQSRISPPVEWR